MLSTKMTEARQTVAQQTRLGWFSIGLLAVVSCAFVLRFWSIDFGLPLITHPDEPLIVDAADRMVSGRTLNPGWFRYPAFIIDIEAAILTVVYTVDKLFGLTPDTIASLAYGGGRSLIAGFGVATVALVGLLGRRLTRIVLASDSSIDLRQRETLAGIAGLVAAVMLAVSFIHVKDSHYLKPDVPTGFFTTLVLWFTLSAWERRGINRTDWLLAGVAIGMAGASKYTGAAIAVVPALAMLMLARDRQSATRITIGHALRMTLGIALVSVAIFLVFNPYILLAPGEFLSPVDGIRAELNHYRSGHDGAEGNDSWRWYLLEIWRNGFGPTLTPLVLLGGVMAVRQILGSRRMRDESSDRHGTAALWLVIVFVPVYYAMIARYPVRFDRQLIPILPYLTLLGGFGVAALLAIVGRSGRIGRSSLGGVSSATIAVVLLLLVLTAPLTIRAVNGNIQTGKPDTRYVALDWIEERVPVGATIAREWHTPPVAQAGYEDIFIRKTNDQPLDWYRASGVDYLVVSSYMYARYIDDPETYPVDAAFYERLFAQPPEASFDGENGPIILIYTIDAAAPAFE